MKAAKLKMSNSKTKGCGHLLLQGNLTLDNIDEIARFFRDAVAKYNKLAIELTEITALDLGFLQLLWCLECEAHERGEDLDLKMQLPTEIQQLLRNTGFTRWLGSAASTTK